MKNCKNRPNTNPHRLILQFGPKHPFTRTDPKFGSCLHYSPDGRLKCELLHTAIERPGYQEVGSMIFSWHVLARARSTHLDFAAGNPLPLMDFGTSR
jgi:hypothetical protein